MKTATKQHVQMHHKRRSHVDDIRHAFRNFRMTLASLLVNLICIDAWSQCYGSEPLRGPEVGIEGWFTHNKDNPKLNRSVKIRHLNGDVPIPVPLWIAMPFATIRLNERIDVNQPKYLSDHKLGLGLLHHAAEGDPSWRVDFIRIGALTKNPAMQSRLITSLIKPFPWLRIRPSDKILSWVGVNYFMRPGRLPLIIPELAWYREGRDGLILDLQAPKRLMVGVQGQMFGFFVGAEQDFTSWDANSHDEYVADWSMQRLIRMKLTIDPVHEFKLSASLLHDPAATHTRANLSTTGRAELGIELTMQWVPEP